MNNLKRLIKSEFYDAGEKSDTYFEIFKNPTSKEINETKNTPDYKGTLGVRGVIDKNGDKYIWPVLPTHATINAKIEKEVPINHIRFSHGSYDADNWHFDLTGYGSNITPYELAITLKDNLDFFSQIGNVNSSLEIYGLKDADDENYFESFNDFIEKFINKKIKIEASRLIKSEFYDGVNKYNTYIEIFKNPTSQEIEDTIKNDTYKCVRGLLYKDGTVYIWPADILHGSMKIENGNLDFTQYRFFTGGKDWINFHTDKGDINYEEFKNAIKIAESILRNIVNLDSYIEIIGLNGKVFQGNYEKFLNLYEDVTKVGRLVKSIDFNKRNINITPNENKTCPSDMPPQFDLKIKENLIPLNQLNEADVKTDKCPRCKYHPLEKKDGFKICLRCNSIYKMLDGKGYLIN